jgi:RNA polymerase sigma-70 factor (ECF subfamily)
MDSILAEWSARNRPQVTSSPDHEPASGDVQRILREYGALLARVAWGYVHGAQDHDDLMQEILLAVWRALPRFRGESSERTFVLRIAHNRGITFAVGQRRFAPLHEADEVVDPAPLAEARMIHQQHRDRLFGAIRRLPEPQRQAIMLQLEGLSVREIAELQGVSENNAGVRLSRARAALRALLGEADR